MEWQGQAIGIGSLPHKDADEALELVFKCLPEIPFWPQLPKRDIREGMLAQFSENLPFLKMGPEGLAFSGFEAAEGELERFYERIIANDVDYFRISPQHAAGLHRFYERLKNTDLSAVAAIKCQVTGPFSFCASLKSDKGITLLHDSVFMQAIAKGLMMKALWQIKLLSEFKKKIIVFVDEPFLASLGSAYTPVNREDVVLVLGEFCRAIKEAHDVLIGVHCCGNTDWSVLMDIKDIDIINFDAFTYLDKLTLYPHDLDKFFRRNGLLCWGIVPTQDFSGQETAGILVARIREGIETLAKKGVDRGQVCERLMVSPACGLGTLDSEKAEGILRVLSQTSGLLRKSP